MTVARRPLANSDTHHNEPGSAIAQAIAGGLGALRAGRRPRVHALLAPVAQPLAANAATATGIDVSMTTDADEVGPMAAKSDALLINLGMLDAPRREGIRAALATGRPFVLDPVKVDRSPSRLAFARELLEAGPAVVKGNGAEMAALGPLPRETVSVTTGAIDVVRDAGGTWRLANGHPLMDRVIATGCATGVVMAGYLALVRNPMAAAAAALSHVNAAAQEAARHSSGPGTFAASWLDALANVDADAVGAAVRCAKNVDLSCYLVLGPDVSDPVGVVRAAVAGGASLVQWRDKSGATAEQVAMVRALQSASDAPVFVNDRADVAALTGAGLHVGHGDLSPIEARALVGDAPIGLTVHTLEEADAADVHAIAYASVGGVFETTSKRNTHPPIGIDGFVQIATRLRERRPDLPICAIAGIDAERAATLAAAGADGVAVMSAVTKAADPAGAARAIRRAVAEGRA